MVSIELPIGRGPGRLTMWPPATILNQAAVGKREFLDSVFEQVAAVHLGACRDPLRIHFDREMTGVGDDDAIFEMGKVFRPENAGPAGDGHDDVGAHNRFIATWRVEPIEMRPKALHRIEFDDADLGVRRTKISGDFAATGAVTEDRDALTVGDPVRDAHVSLKNALADRVLVFGELFDGAIVDDQNGHGEFAPQRLEPHPARRRLLGPTEECGIRAFSPEIEKVTAVVEQKIRPPI